MNPPKNLLGYSSIFCHMKSCRYSTDPVTSDGFCLCAAPHGITKIVCGVNGPMCESYKSVDEGKTGGEAQ